MKDENNGGAHRAVWGSAALVVLVGLAAYHNSFLGPFIFDDASSISNNPTIRSLWPPWRPLEPPHVAVTVQGRPVLNFSFALNYAVGGNDVVGYHVANLAIHLAAALALFGLVRRTLLLPRLCARFAPAATPLAAAGALLWVAHPLQTEAVAYVVQRAESLMGMFYLLTLYGFSRSLTAAAPGRWRVLGIGACALGMATKEVMVSAPLMALLYDRAFVAGSFRDAWRARGRFHAGLAATWLVLGWLVLGAGGNRGGSAGFDVGVAWSDYLLTQFTAIVHYLRLALWPQPLVFEYGTFWIDRIADVLPAASVVAALVLAGAWAHAKNKAVGFFAALFFAILSVTSLVPGTTQMIVEHRMYLALASLCVGAVIGAYALLGRRIVFAGVAAAFALVLVTAARNATYGDEIGLWRDTVAKRPRNALAREMLAEALDRAGDTVAGLAQHRAAVEIFPGFAIAHDSLGQDLARTGRNAEAMAEHETALRLKPDFVDAHNNLGAALVRAGRAGEAVSHFEAALRLKPDFAEAHYNLANALAEQGRRADAIAQFEAALRLRPDYFEAHFNLANTLAETGAASDAIAHYESALRLKPAHSRAHYNLGNTLIALGRIDAAIVHYRAAVKLAPDFLDAHFNLATALQQQGRSAEAIGEYEAVLRLNPNATDARAALARVRGR